MNKTEEKAITRNRMIEAAIIEFGLHGYEGASTNQICAGASISKGLLYHYFKSKENLFAETLRYCMEEFGSSGGALRAAHRLFCRSSLSLPANRPICLRRLPASGKRGAAAMPGGNLASGTGVTSKIFGEPFPQAGDGQRAGVGGAVYPHWFYFTKIHFCCAAKQAGRRGGPAAVQDRTARDFGTDLPRDCGLTGESNLF